MEVRKISYRDMPLSLDGLIAWLETQDPATAYCFATEKDCLLDRYGHASGEARQSGIPNSGLPSDLFWEPSPALYQVAMGSPHTYGAALSRAKALKEAS